MKTVTYIFKDIRLQDRTAYVPLCERFRDIAQGLGRTDVTIETIAAYNARNEHCLRLAIEADDHGIVEQEIRNHFKAVPYTKRDGKDMNPA